MQTLCDAGKGNDEAPQSLVLRVRRGGGHGRSQRPTQSFWGVGRVQRPAEAVQATVVKNPARCPAHL